MERKVNKMDTLILRSSDRLILPEGKIHLFLYQGQMFSGADQTESCFSKMLLTWPWANYPLLCIWGFSRSL